MDTVTAYSVEDYEKAWVGQIVLHPKSGWTGVVMGVRPEKPREKDGPYVSFLVFDQDVKLTWAHRRFLESFRRIPDDGESKEDRSLEYSHYEPGAAYIQTLRDRAGIYADHPGCDRTSLEELLDKAAHGEPVRAPALDPRVARYTSQPLPWIF